MRLPRTLFWLGRMYFTGFVLLTSGYCLLTYIPFTFHQFLKADDLLPWLTAFARLHAYLYWTALASVTVTLLEDLAPPRTRLISLLFLGCGSLLGILVSIHPLLPNLKHAGSSLAWSLATLIPLAWLALIDVSGSFKMVRWEPPGNEDRRVFYVALQSALLLSILYEGVFHRRLLVATASVAFWTREGLLLFGWSLFCHLLVFMGLFTALCLVRALANWARVPARAEFMLLCLVAALFLYGVFWGTIFPTISFQDRDAKTYAAVLALTLAASLAGLSVRLYRSSEGKVGSGLDLQLAVLTISRHPRWFVKAISISLICALAYELSVHSARMDWNNLVQKLIVILVWALTFAWMYRVRPRPVMGREHTAIMLLASLAVLGAYKTIQGSEPVTRFRSSEQYASYNPSFRLIGEVLPRSGGQRSSYAFLARNSNIPSSRRVAPVEVNLSSHVVPLASPKPNIFIFVIDSLRQDYLSPYNTAVSFTPAIESFAHESVVLKNAFTPYGGTGLAEPSLWVGGMLLHKQYILPFWPMNALAKLLATEQYQSYISSDTILSTIVAPSLPFIELDKGVLNMNYDLCNSLHDLEDKISQRTEHNPVFAYTQPQNLHVSVIQREKTRLPPGESYPGFYAPYASRVKRVDHCFGSFIEFLKLKGLYDNSIVVLTSDHGDSLGEDGRWGHAYTIFPEVIRIPLIFRLPASLRKGLVFDRGAVALLTDVTPTLYYLLGHRPVKQNAIFGRPLFTGEGEQTSYRRDSYLIASSYAAVYGLLTGNGRQLFIEDAVNYRNYQYDLGASPAGTSVPVNAAVQARGEKEIVEHILAINRFYGFGAGSK